MQKFWNPRKLAALLLPAAFFVCCRPENRPPDDPAIPTGPSSGLKDSTYAFTTVAIDPDGDSISYRFYWSDTMPTDWSPFVPSGTAWRESRTWTEHGVYLVRARARDIRGLGSNLSPALTVSIANVAPLRPAPPNGPDTAEGGQSRTFRDSTYDLNGDYMAFQFDWGDGDTSSWTDFVPSESAATHAHDWLSRGDYLVRARAKDQQDAVSDWSEPHLIRVSGPTVHWRSAAAGDERSASPAVGPDGTIYLAEQSGSVRAMNPDGSLKWQLRIPGVIDAPPTIAGDGAAYFSGGSYLHSVRPDGTPNYRLNRGHIPDYFAMSLVDDSALYYPGPRLQSLNRDGVVRWTSPYADGTGPQVVAADGTVYFQTGGRLVALGPDGSLRWAVPFFGSGRVPPSLDDRGTIYCAGDDGTLTALDSSGGVVWTCEVDDRGRDIYAAPAIGVDGVLYCGFDRGLCAVTSSGAKAWTYVTRHDVRTTPAIAADGTIYFGCDDHRLYALNPDSTLKWRYFIGSYVRSSPVIGPDGTVYVASYDGYLYAIQGGSPPAASPWPMYLHDARHTGWAGTR